MEKGFSIYKCKLVKDGHIDYEGVINHPEDVFTAAKKMGLLDFSEEVVSMFTTDTKGNITGYHEVSHGDLNTSIVHPREVFKRAISNNAAALVLVHNHPSGETTPSDEDINITKRLTEVGELIGIPVLDHIIIGNENNYCSIKSEEL